MSEKDKDQVPKTLQEKIETSLNDFFGNWGLKVARNPCRVFWLSLLVFLVLCGGMSKQAGFEDES
jgi:hypothetical protein